eukprot:24578-Pelagococcus_subviridis.AAC.1
MPPRDPGRRDDPRRARPPRRARVRRAPPRDDPEGIRARVARARGVAGGGTRDRGRGRGPRRERGARGGETASHTTAFAW